MGWSRRTRLVTVNTADTPIYNIRRTILSHVARSFGNVCVSGPEDGLYHAQYDPRPSYVLVFSVAVYTVRSRDMFELESECEEYNHRHQCSVCVAGG